MYNLNKSVELLEFFDAANENEKKFASAGQSFQYFSIMRNFFV